MNKPRVLSRLIGKPFGKDPDTQAEIFITTAVDITDFCSEYFRSVYVGGVAIMEYSKTVGGEGLLWLKTKYRQSGQNCFQAGVPFKFEKIEACDLIDMVRESRPGVGYWGIKTGELYKLIFTKWEEVEVQLELPLPD